MAAEGLNRGAILTTLEYIRLPWSRCCYASCRICTRAGTTLRLLQVMKTCALPRGLGHGSTPGEHSQHGLRGDSALYGVLRLRLRRCLYFQVRMIQSF